MNVLGSKLSVRMTRLNGFWVNGEELIEVKRGRVVQKKIVSPVKYKRRYILLRDMVKVVKKKSVA